jgi:hypothetical protein
LKLNIAIEDLKNLSREMYHYQECIKDAENDQGREFWKEQMVKTNTNFITGACATFGDILRLKFMGLGVECKSTFANVNQTIRQQDLDDKTFHIKVVAHRYLTVDSTAGQFIKSHHQVFIGTRD